MPKHNNSAYRAHVILQRAASLHSSTRFVDGWAAIFETDENAVRDLAFTVLEKIQLVRSEIIKARENMRSTSFTSDLYEPAFENALSAINPLLIGHDWSNVLRYLSGETLSSIRFCSELLPDEEREIDGEELETLWQQLYSLRQTAAAANIDPELKEFIFEQIRIIEQALDDYEILGARAFRRGLVEASLSYSDHEAVVEVGAAEPAVTELKGIWSQIVKATERVETVQKLLGSGMKIARLIGGVGEHLSRVV